MVKRIVAIGFIVVCTSIAWAILGSTIFYRTYSPDAQQLRARVASSWGTSQEQTPPTAGYEVVSHKQVPGTKDGVPIVREVEERKSNLLPIEKSRVNVALWLDYRRKGLLWYSTYRVDFSGAYEFSNPSDQPQQVTFRMKLPAEQAVYDNLTFAVNDVPLTVSNEKNEAVATATVAPKETAALKIGYHSQGLDNLELQLRRRSHTGKRFSAARHHELSELRPSRKHSFADGRAETTEWMGISVEL